MPWSRYSEYFLESEKLQHTEIGCLRSRKVEKNEEVSKFYFYLVTGQLPQKIDAYPIETGIVSNHGCLPNALGKPGLRFIKKDVLSEL